MITDKTEALPPQAAGAAETPPAWPRGIPTPEGLFPPRLCNLFLALQGLGWIAHDCGASRDIPRDDAAGANNGIIPDADAGQDDRPASNPDVLADPHRLAGFQTLAAQDRSARVVRREDLHERADTSATEFLLETRAAGCG
jgi:hypothetical protein